VHQDGLLFWAGKGHSNEAATWRVDTFSGAADAIFVFRGLRRRQRDRRRRLIN